MVDIDRLLHDADRMVMGAEFARRMGDHTSADALDIQARTGYQQALDADPKMSDPAWKETGNRDASWLRRNGFITMA